MSGLTLLFVARVPVDRVEAFARYEDAVLPLLAEHGGRLDRRERSGDGTLEAHLLHFPSREALESYRRDPRRAAAGTPPVHGELLTLDPVPGQPGRFRCAWRVPLDLVADSADLLRVARLVADVDRSVEDAGRPAGGPDAPHPV